MYITCLDVEGVLVPEIWIAFAEASGIPELKKTTRDEPDYDKLMKWRLGYSERTWSWSEGDPGNHQRRSIRCRERKSFWTSFGLFHTGDPNQ